MKYLRFVSFPGLNLGKGFVINGAVKRIQRKKER